MKVNEDDFRKTKTEFLSRNTLLKNTNRRFFWKKENGINRKH